MERDSTCEEALYGKGIHAERVSMRRDVPRESRFHAERGSVWKGIPWKGSDSWISS